MSGLSASIWVHVRFYRKLQAGYILGPQLKGESLAQGTTPFAFKFQIRENWQFWNTDGYHHFGFHTYTGGEQFHCIDWPNHSAEYVENHVGVWHCYEIAVQPSTRSLKCWIDGVQYTNWTGSDFVESSTMIPNILYVSCYYGWAGAESPQTQSYYIDDLIIKSGTDAEETAGTLYIGLDESSPSRTLFRP